MKRLLVVMVMLATVTVAPAAAVPAANNSTGSASTTTANATDLSLSGGPVAVDGVTTVTGWTFADGQMRVRLRASQYHVVTLAASAETTGRVSHNAYRSVVMHGGETATVALPADRTDGTASVSLTTSACIDSGTCPTLYSEDTSVGNPYAAVGPTAGWFAGAGVVMVVVSVTVWRRRDRDRPDVEGVRD